MIDESLKSELRKLEMESKFGNAEEDEELDKRTLNAKIISNNQSLNVL